MNLNELLAELDRRGIVLSATPDGKLHYRAPKEALTPDFRAEIARQKAALVAVLTDSDCHTVSGCQEDSSGHLDGVSTLKLTASEPPTPPTVAKAPHQDDAVARRKMIQPGKGPRLRIPPGACGDGGRGFITATDTVFTFPISGRDEVHMSVNTSKKGRRYLDIRVFYTPGDEAFPTTKGISLAADHLLALKKGLEKMEAALKGQEPA